MRGIDRTLEYAEYTEEERPVSIQIFGGDPGTMAEAARIVQDLGADIVDVNMGCPVPKIAKHNAGCSLMREPEHAASVIAAMARAVTIPVTVKMRAGWDAARDQRADAGEDGRGRGGCRGRRSRPDGGAVVQRIVRLEPDLRGRGGRRHPRARQRRLRRAGPDHRAARAHARERRARRTRRAAEPVDPRAGRAISRRAAPVAVSPHANAGSSCSTTWTCCSTTAWPRPTASGTRPSAIRRRPSETRTARGRERWVINKVRALGSWYTKGFENGSHLRVAINRCESLAGAAGDDLPRSSSRGERSLRGGYGPRSTTRLHRAIARPRQGACEPHHAGPEPRRPPDEHLERRQQHEPEHAAGQPVRAASAASPFQSATRFRARWPPARPAAAERSARRPPERTAARPGTGARTRARPPT